KSGPRNVHDEERGHQHHGVVRLWEGADFPVPRIHARLASGEHQPRGEVQRRRRQPEGRQGGLGEPNTWLLKSTPPKAEGQRLGKQIQIPDSPASRAPRNDEEIRCSSLPTTTKFAVPCKSSSRPRSILTSMNGRRGIFFQRMSCSRSSAVSAFSASTS